nr:methyltransferase domain-containing protein [Thalassotalea piscium]
MVYGLFTHIKGIIVTLIRVAYQTIEFGDIDIHLRTLRDKNQFSDDNNEAKNLGINSTLWPIFGVIWPSSIVLANYMNHFNTQGKRILEIGCGIGLTSLMLNKRHDDITSTDMHPEVQRFLDKNTHLNRDADIPFYRTNWADLCPELKTFDVIIGSDILYEDEHIDLLIAFIERHANPACEVILVDPGRGRKAKFSKKMALLGYSANQEKAQQAINMPDAYNGYILSFKR